MSQRRFINRSGPPDDKPKKTRVACDQCRKAKMKCGSKSTTEPCPSCKDHSRQCTYTSPSQHAPAAESHAGSSSGTASTPEDQTAGANGSMPADSSTSDTVYTGSPQHDGQNLYGNAFFTADLQSPVSHDTPSPLGFPHYIQPYPQHTMSSSGNSYYPYGLPAVYQDSCTCDRRYIQHECPCGLGCHCYIYSTQG